MKHLGDITKIDGAVIEPVNIIIGGSPCQDLSVAGKGAGLAGNRSVLFMDQIRIVKEMRRADEANGRSGTMVRPRFMVWENVPGALSSNKRKDFGAVLHEIVKIVNEEAPAVPMPSKGWSTSGCLMGMDGEWSIAWRVFDAQFWGVPQRRKRIALVADFGGLTAPEILFEREGVHGDHQPRERSWKEIAGDLGKGSDRASGENGKVLAVDARNAVLNEVNNTLQSNAAHSVNGNNVVMYSIDRAAFNQGKNAQYDFDVRDDGTVSTLVSKGPSAVCFRKSAHPRSKDDPQQWEEAAVSDTLNTFDKGALIQEEKSATLATNNDQTLFQPIGFDGYNGSITGDAQATIGVNCGMSTGRNGMIDSEYLVRRLTPLECERLQGFPDNWTDIGSWTDTSGKVHKESSDSARYTAMGNSIALPSWYWLLQRLSRYCGEDKTMGSLFDGVGGFPLLWSEINGIENCRWASEIEEFCIAVTKYHFGEKNDED